MAPRARWLTIAEAVKRVAEARCARDCLIRLQLSSRRRQTFSPMDILGDKHSSLRELVEQLAERLPPSSFILVNGWDDAFAIGLAAPSRPDHLVYITSERDVHGRYFMSREKPAGHDLEAFRNAGSNWFASFDTLARAIAE